MRLSAISGRLACLLVLALGPCSVAQAQLVITVDKMSQRMTVSRDGAVLYTWPVSTGGYGYDTPSGSFTPTSMEKDHFSREWDDAPMPNSIFFTPQGHAIHGTYQPRRLGSAVSHGCVRLSRKNAATLYDLVAVEGLESTQVIVTGPDLGKFPTAPGRGGAPGVVGIPLGPTWAEYYAPVVTAPGP